MATIYRYYDYADMLLYVGITGAGISRSYGHSATAVWWEHVTRATFHHATLETCRMAEKLAILVERPAYNRQGRMTEARRQAMLGLLDEHDPRFEINAETAGRILGLTVDEVECAMRWGFLKSDYKRVYRFSWEQVREFIGEHVWNVDTTNEYRLRTVMPMRSALKINAR